MLKKTLVLDIDGVVCNHAKSICEWVNVQFGVCSQIDDIKEYNHDFGCTTFFKAVEECYPKGDFILKMEPYHDAKAFIENIKEDVTIEFASARKHSHQATMQWIRKHFGDYKISFVQKKAELTSDFLIDDYPQEAVDASKKGIRSFIIQRPWNESFSLSMPQGQNLHYIRNFCDTLDYI